MQEAHNATISLIANLGDLYGLTVAFGIHCS